MALGVGCVAILILHVWMGSSDAHNPFALRMSLPEVMAQLFSGRGGQDHVHNTMVWEVRLPRALACALVGGILGLVGSAFQALFRNPLADPYIVGTSSGAAVGGAIAIWLGFAGWAGGMGLLLSAFATGVMSLAIVMTLGVHRGVVDTQRLLLAGVVMGAFLASAVAWVLMAAGEDSNRVMRWLLGSATPMFWDRIPPLAVALGVGATLLIVQSRRLNAFALGEETARRLGVSTGRLKPAILVTGTAMTAIAVGTVGVIGFLGLLAPHIARRCVGVDWRISLPASGLMGMMLLCASDILAQWGVPGAEIPVGVITALLGAPFLLVLLRKQVDG